jgi:hypothetical protein
METINMRVSDAEFAIEHKKILEERKKLLEKNVQLKKEKLVAESRSSKKGNQVKLMEDQFQKKSLSVQEEVKERQKLSYSLDKLIEFTEKINREKAIYSITYQKVTKLIEDAHHANALSQQQKFVGGIADLLHVDIDFSLSSMEYVVPLLGE